VIPEPVGPQGSGRRGADGLRGSGRRGAAGSQGSGRRGGLDAVLLRRLPGTSAVHRLWAGTKLISLSALTLATGLNTSWQQLAAVGAVTTLAVLAARVPWRARPRLPVWFWALMGLGLGLALIGGGGGRFARLIGFTIAFSVLSLVVAWTTDLADIGPALARLGRPLRRLGVPVDEWVQTTVLAVRCLPLLIDECRVVMAARRQRPVSRDLGSLMVSVVDAINACMAAAVRRASDLGEVMTLRGGMAPPRGPAAGGSLHRRDVVALAVVLAASILPSALG
jgi:energy-coupling factor transport system permease protein